MLSDEPLTRSTPPWARSRLWAVLLALFIAIGGTLAAVVLSSPADAQTTCEETPPPDEPPPTDPPPTDPPAGSGLFAPESFWNEALPGDAPLDPDSDRLVRTLQNEVERNQEASSGPSISTHQNTTPLYTVPADQPTVRVALDDPDPHWRAGLQAAFEQVPIPADAVESKGVDGYMTVWQPSTDKLWELYRARKEADGWHAEWGGAIENVSQSPGYYTQDAWPGAHNRWGSTATSLPVVGGTMMLDEFEAGEVDHALAFAIPWPRRDVYAWPAQRTDGSGEGDYLIPEGARFRLDPSVDLSTLSMHPVARMMAEAVQRHGMVLRDRTGSAVNFYAEDPRPKPEPGTDWKQASPYFQDGGYFRGQWPQKILASFPWEHLQLLDMRLCSDQYSECTRSE